MLISRLFSILTSILLVQTSILPSSQASQPTVVNNSFAAKQLLGKHKLNLQWIGSESWEEFGNLNVVNKQGTFFIKGRQTKGEDYLDLDGEVLKIDARSFTFHGTILIQVSHINRGKVCERYGKMLFKITEKRKYWRLQEMQNPCDTATDYVDIFMR